MSSRSGRKYNRVIVLIVGVITVGVWWMGSCMCMEGRLIIIRHIKTFGCFISSSGMKCSIIKVLLVGLNLVWFIIRVIFIFLEVYRCHLINSLMICGDLLYKSRKENGLSYNRKGEPHKNEDVTY